MAIEYHNKETEYRLYMGEGSAFVCNNLGTGPENHVVHHSDCSILNRAGPAKYGLHTSVRKRCSRDLQDLISSLTSEFGAEGQGFRYCQFCFR